MGSMDLHEHVWPAVWVKHVIMAAVWVRMYAYGMGKARHAVWVAVWAHAWGFGGSKATLLLNPANRYVTDLGNVAA